MSTRPRLASSYTISADQIDCVVDGARKIREKIRAGPELYAYEMNRYRSGRCVISLGLMVINCIVPF